MTSQKKFIYFVLRAWGLKLTVFDSSLKTSPYSLALRSTLNPEPSRPLASDSAGGAKRSAEFRRPRRLDQGAPKVV